jgi:hypothetical protein
MLRDAGEEVMLSQKVVPSSGSRPLACSSPTPDRRRPRSLRRRTSSCYCWEAGVSQQAAGSARRPMTSRSVRADDQLNKPVGFGEQLAREALGRLQVHS